MREIELAQLGRDRFMLKVREILSRNPHDSRPREVIGFEAANAVASMEGSLTLEEKAAYHEGINYAVQYWVMSPQISHIDED